MSNDKSSNSIGSETTKAAEVNYLVPEGFSTSIDVTELQGILCLGTAIAQNCNILDCKGCILHENQLEVFTATYLPDISANLANSVTLQNYPQGNTTEVREAADSEIVDTKEVGRKFNLFVTFGQAHVHRVNGLTFDKDSVAVINCTSYEHGRELAFEYFGGKFCFTYTEEEVNNPGLDKLAGLDMSYFPRGIIPAN